MRVRFYGKLSATIGPHVEVPIEAPCTVAQVRRQLRAAHPDLAQLLDDNRIRTVVGDTIVPDTYRLKPADEPEFLAPVSGG